MIAILLFIILSYAYSVSAERYYNIYQYHIVVFSLSLHSVCGNKVCAALVFLKCRLPLTT